MRIDLPDWLETSLTFFGGAFCLLLGMGLAGIIIWLLATLVSKAMG